MCGLALTLDELQASPGRHSTSCRELQGFYLTKGKKLYPDSTASFNID